MDAAYRLLLKACGSDGADAETWFLFAGVSAALGRLEDVVQGCQHTVELAPGHALAWFNLGLACFKLGRLEDAIAAYKNALAIEPDAPAALGNLGATYLEAGDPAQAVLWCGKAVARDPRLLPALNSLGIAHRELGAYRDALDCFERGAAIGPGDADVHWNRALALLKLGDYARGWDEFEWRWRYEKAMQRATPYPGWTGTRPLPSLLVYAEQGVGDQVMFASCLPELMPAMDRVVVECDKRLAPIFTRSFPGIHFHGGSWDERRPECSRKIDCQIPMGSLPRLFRRDRAAFPRTAGYLVPDGEKVAEWRNRLAGLGTGMKVGLSWRGGNDAKTRSKRSIPLQEWSRILAVPDVVFVDLQYGNHEEELRAIRASGASVWSPDGIDAMADLDSFASLIAALDLVITVDNSTLHLAAALGVETWGLLPYDSDWRWEAGQDRSLWYPSLKLFSQRARNHWTDILETSSEELSRRAVAHRAGTST
jgi:hypothetical protein